MEDKKDIIVKGAFSLLMKEGVQALSFDGVAQEAGLSRQLVRYYFSEKDDLMMALCDYLADLYREALLKGVAAAEPKNRLNLFLDFYFDLVEAHPKPRDDQVYDAIFAWAAGNPKIQENLRTQYGLLGQVVAHEISLMLPGLTKDESQELSYLFVCLMYGHWKMVASLGLSEDHKYVVRRSMDRLLKSYSQKTFEPLKQIEVWR